MRKKKRSVIDSVRIAFMTAVLCILGPLSFPIGFVPISLTNLVIYIVVAILGWKKGTISYLLYLGMGILGVPVFSGFSAGIGTLLGPTGGYLFGFIFLSIISGWFLEHGRNRHNKAAYISKETVKVDAKVLNFFRKNGMYLLGMVLGMTVCYSIGTLWLAYQAKITLWAAFLTGVVPFLLGDLLKMMIALILIPKIKEPLRKQKW